jgi:hypothetical protein
MNTRFAWLLLPLIPMLHGCSSAPAGQRTPKSTGAGQSGNCDVQDFQTRGPADLSRDQSPFAQLILNNPSVKFTQSTGNNPACPTTIHEVLSAFDQIAGTSRVIFSVDETGDQPGQSDGGHRFIISQLTGAKGQTQADVLIAPLEAQPGVLDTGSLEVISFDPSREVNVFYKFDPTGGDPRWSVMGNGSQIDPQHSQDVTASQGQFFCQGCHMTGALNFKERQTPWNNWKGFFAMPSFPAPNDHLLNAWFNGDSQLPKEPRIGGAYGLETVIEQGNQRLVSARVKHVLAGDVAGGFPGQSLKTLVRELLCDVGEVNLISSPTHSRLATSSGIGTPANVVEAPQSLITDDQLFALVNGRPLSLTLAPIIPGDIPLASYQKAIAHQSIQDIASANDTMFALFAPQRSSTSEMVGQQLVSAGWLTNETLADVLMTDFPNPMFSQQRCALAATIPNVAQGTQAADSTNGATAFIQSWIRALQSSGLPGAAGLAKRLSTPGQLAAQKQKVQALASACQARVTSTPDAYAADLVTLAQQRRAELVQDEHLNRGNRGFPQIVESLDLFPNTSDPVRLGAKHLQPDCTLGATAPAIDD